MSQHNPIRDMFFEECEELLEQLSDGLALMASAQHDDETVNAVFRAVHSIKGGAGAFGLNVLVAFSHRFETVLDLLRSRKLQLTAEIVHTLQRSSDFLTDLVERARSGDTDEPAQAAGFLAALDRCMGASPAAPAPAEPAEPAPAADFGDAFGGAFGFSAVPLALDFDEGDAAGREVEIHFRPLSGLYANGHNPVLILSALADLGAVETSLDLDDLPELADFDPTKPTLAWTIRLNTDKDGAAVREVFDFVHGTCLLTIKDAAEDAPAAATEPAPEPMVMPAVAVQVAPPAAAAAPPTAAAVAAPAMPQSAPEAHDQGGPKSTLRVELDRVDRLINAVGELIINQSMIAQRVQELRLATDADVVTHVEDYRLLARDLQEAVMAIRAQPVKPLFQRMSRIVREAAESTGKKARLVTLGEGTEVDKTVIERLADPLTHMVRNSADHGLESPEKRIAVGKDPTGTIQLSAMHRSGSVIITIKDDGAGLNRPKILDIARKKGLVAPELELTDPEIDALLFMPGFSTAEKVSNLSGRGVGLDVVRNAVSALGGRITITSVAGQGTEFVISLPLTLAVLDGMVVSVAGQTLVIPLTSILETIIPGKDDIHMLGTSERLLSVRGRYVPMVDVARGLGLARAGDDRARQVVLIETENQAQVALMIDTIHDQRQVVIKGLESNYGTVPGVSAATVLGDGQVALILDPDAIAKSRLALPVDGHLFARNMEGRSHAPV